MTRPVAAALLLAGAACAGSDRQACDTLPSGADRDQCWRARVGSLGPDAVDAVLPLTEQIEDRLVRSMTLSAWVERHADHLSDAQVLSLCGSLRGVDAQACRAPYTTPHLR